MRRNYEDPEYKKWRKKVYARDKYTCQWPGCTNKNRLNAHHIRRWSDFPALRFVVENGISLCYLHHKMISGMESIYESVFYKILKDKEKKHE